LISKEFVSIFELNSTRMRINATFYLTIVILALFPISSTGQSDSYSIGFSENELNSIRNAMDKKLDNPKLSWKIIAQERKDSINKVLSAIDSYKNRIFSLASEADIASYYGVISDLYRLINQYDSSFLYAKKLEDFIQENKKILDFDLAYYYQIIGISYFNKNDFFHAEIYFDKALTLLIEYDTIPSIKGEIYNSKNILVIINLESGNLSKAFEFRKEMEEEFDDHPAFKWRIDYLNNFANLYKKINQGDSAINILTRAILLNLNAYEFNPILIDTAKHIDYENLARLFSNLGRIYFIYEDYNKSLIANEIGLKIKKRIIQDYRLIDISTTVINKGHSILEFGLKEKQEDKRNLLLDSANKYFQWAIKLYQENNEYDNLSVAYHYYGKYLIGKKDYDSAISTLRLSLNYSRANSEIYGQSNLALSELYHDLGMNDSAFVKLNDYKDYKKHLEENINLITSQMLGSFKTAIDEIEKKNLELENLNKSETSTNRILGITNKILGVGLGILAILIIILYFLYIRLKNAKVTIEIKDDEISQKDIEIETKDEKISQKDIEIEIKEKNWGIAKNDMSKYIEQLSEEMDNLKVEKQEIDEKHEGDNEITQLKVKLKEKSNLIDRQENYITKFIERTQHKYIMGDNFENIHNSTIINRSEVNKSFTKVQSMLDDEHKAVLEEILEKVNNSNEQFAVDCFRQFNEEICKDSVNKSKLELYWNNIKSIIPEVTKFAGAVANIIALFS